MRGVNDSPERYYSVRELIHIFDVGADTVRRWLSDGHVRGIRLPGLRGDWRVPASEVERLRQHSVVRGEQSHGGR